MRRYEAMGEEMIKGLGFESKLVVLYWTAFENQNWQICEKIYKKFKK